MSKLCKCCNKPLPEHAPATRLYCIDCAYKINAERVAESNNLRRAREEWLADHDPSFEKKNPRQSELCLRCGKPVVDPNRHYCKECREFAQKKFSARDERRVQRSVDWTYSHIQPKAGKPSTSTCDGEKAFLKAMKDERVRENVDRLIKQAEGGSAFHRPAFIMPLRQDEDFEAYLPKSVCATDKMLKSPAPRQKKEPVKSEDPCWYSTTKNEEGREFLVEHRGQQYSYCKH